MTRSTVWGWSFVGLLLVLGVWMSVAGRVTLYGLPDDVLEGLVRARGLDHGFQTGALFTLPPGDAVWLCSTFLLFITLAALAVFVVAAARVWRYPPSVVLATGFLFCNSPLWIAISTPQEALSALLLAAVLAALLRGMPYWSALLLLPLGAVSPGGGFMMLFPVVGVALGKRGRSPVKVAALIATVAALSVLLWRHGYRFEPGFQGLDPWIGLPLLLMLLPAHRRLRAVLYLSLLVGSVLTGLPQLAAAVALGDLPLLLRERSTGGAPPEEADPGAMSVPVAPLLQAVLVVLLIAVVLPGEQYLNRKILIPAQKKDVPFPVLFLPFALHDHAERWNRDGWRAGSPYPELTEADLQAVEKLRSREPLGPVGVVTPGETGESRRVALLYALLSERPLAGWSADGSLQAPFLLCKRLGRNVLTDLPLVIRDGSSAAVHPPASLPEETGTMNFEALIAVADRLQVVGPAGGAYRWRSMTEPPADYVLAFNEGPARVVFTHDAGTVELSSLDEEPVTRTFRLEAARAGLTFSGKSRLLPARSLVPLSFSLENIGTRPLGSEQIRGLRLAPEEAEALSPLQPLERRFILYPGEEIPVELVLITPLTPEEFRLEASAELSGGTTLALPIEGDPAFRTRPRLAPVGSWVEQP